MSKGDNLLVKMVLTQRDKQSDAWRVLLPYLEDRLQMCRVQNDGSHSMEITSNLRGQIAVLKELIELDKDMPVIETSNL